MSNRKGPVLIASWAAATAVVVAVAGGEAALAMRFGGVAGVNPLVQWALLSRASFGLLAPVAAVLGVLGGGLAVGVAPHLAAGWERLTSAEPGAQSRRLALPLMALSSAVSLLLVAHLALRWLLVPASPVGIGLGFALSAIVVLRLWWGATFRLCSMGAQSLLRWNISTPLSLGAAFVLFVAPLCWGIEQGNTGGTGGFWKLLGVLRREGIHFSAPITLVLVMLAALAPPLGRAITALRIGLGWRSALIVGSVSMAGFWGSTQRWLDNPEVSLPLERSGGASSLALSIGRRWSDRDKDGFSAYLGGGDCDDSRGDINPAARDVPGNAVDEDCSGEDALAVAVQRRPAPIIPPDVSQPLALPIANNLNVVFLTIDTLRHDLGYTGYSRPISPNIDRLAERSVVFERAYSLASYTGKSMGPLLIGRYPSETHRGWWHFNYFDERDTFVQERLQKAGIRTLSVQGHWYFTPKYGLGRGFDVSDTSATPRKPQREGDRTVNSDRLTDAAIAQLSNPENTRGQFYLWAHYLDPHAEYMRHPQFHFGKKGRDRYDSEVAFTDQHIGRLLTFIENSAFAERTAIVITSDHGEAFGENNMWRHGNEVWETLIRVPLIVYVPGASPRKYAVRRSAIDLVPTILQLLAVRLPEGEDRLSGVSLVEDILSSSEHQPRQRPVLIDMSAGPYNSERRAFIDDDQKLIVSSGRTLGLYDLANDPREAHNLRRLKDELQPMKRKMEVFLQKLRLVPVKPR